MATIKRSWDTVDELYKTDLFGGGDPDIDASRKYSSVVDLVGDGCEGALVHLGYSGSGTPDALEVAVYSSLNGTDYDDIALFAFEVGAQQAEGEVSFIARDVPYFKVGMKRMGSSGTFDVELTCRKWNYVSA